MAGEYTAFFYGTLMAREVLYRVCFGASKVPAELTANIIVQPAILHDYCRHRVKHCDYPGIIAEKGQSVQGTYVSGLTAANIHHLDIFEGSQYVREKVEVELLDDTAGGKGNRVQTESYIFTAGDEYLEKREWDYDGFRKQCMHRWADHSEEYQEVDEATGPAHDPTGGRGINVNRKA